jgi:hypothetical protein
LSAQFSYSRASLPVASFDITDRLTNPNANFTKSISTPTTINDGYQNYYAKTNGFNTYSSQYTLGLNPVNKWIAGGQGGNTLSFSNDGIKWYPLGASIFTTACYNTLWNGYIWTACGQGGNTLAYSYDSLQWTGLGTAIFSTAAYNIAWNGYMFVACGQGTNTMAYSYDGINWTASTNSNTVLSGATTNAAIDWNGLYWLVGSDATTNKVALSTDGISWTGLGGSSVFSGRCSALLWTGSVWIAGGSTSGSLGVLAYSSNNGTSWTSVTCPITTRVTGLACNRQLIVAIGYTSATGTGNTLAYSTDIYGTSWRGLGTTPFNNFSANSFNNVKWANNKFVAFSRDTTYRIAYSYNGSTWIPSTTSNTIFTTGALGGDCATMLPHTIIFPTNSMISGNLISRDNGVSWSTANSLASANSLGWNGNKYVLGAAPGASSYLTSDICGNYIQLPFGTDPSGVNVIKWNGTQWLIGTLSSSNKQVMSSYDGLNWMTTSVSNFAQSNYPCNGISWNGTLWVVSGLTSTGTYIAYSGDSINWSLASSTLGGGPVEWNGSYFLCGGPISGSTTNFAISSNGGTWTAINAGSFGTVQGIAWNGTLWVATTNSTTTAGIITSSNGYNWTGVGGTQSYTHRGIQWNGISFVVSTNNTIIRYSYDGVNWTNVSLGQSSSNSMLWNNPSIGIMNIQQPTIVGGVGTNSTLAYSIDGIHYRNLGNNIFTTGCYAVQWNGSIWLAGGAGTNTLAYSYDGLSWKGLGAITFTSACYSITWNNVVWVAGGAGGNTLATSSDGKTWNGLGTSVFDVSGLSVNWNGSVWMAVGNGSSHTMAYSTNASGNSWTGLGKTTFTSQGNHIIWIVNKWVAGGAGGNTIAYTAAAGGTTGWTATGSTAFSTSCNSLYWNGTIAVAVGTGNGNTIATSTDGITWTGRGITVFSSAGNDVYWNTKRWVAVGAGGNTIAYSYNGSTWYSGLNTASLLTSGICVASNSKIGTSIVNSGLYMNTNDVLVVNTPHQYDDSITSDSAISINMNLPI